MPCLGLFLAAAILALALCRAAGEADEAMEEYFRR